MAKQRVFGCRIPYHFFVTGGVGESDICTHAGSFHLALADARIERYNIMTYSSILPAIAREVEMSSSYAHGSVLETIMARVDVERGERATAGIMYGWLHERKTGKKQGGLVVEYMEGGTEDEARGVLRSMLQELYEAPQSDLVKRYELIEGKVITRTIAPTKKYGTALVALGFVDYIFPELKKR